MEKISRSDRSSLIRLAGTLPKGDESRRAILASLTRVAIEFNTQEALSAYLKDHPDADRSKHSVKKIEKDTGPAPKGWRRPNQKELEDDHHPNSLMKDTEKGKYTLHPEGSLSHNSGKGHGMPKSWQGVKGTAKADKHIEKHQSGLKG